MSRKSTRSKASPSTWLILILLVITICLLVVSFNSIKSGKEKEATIAKLEKEVVKLTPPKADPLPYQELYSDMKVDKPEKWKREKKTAYLTFDDGPSEVTKDILDTLKKYNIKATFFVVGSDSDHNLMKRIIDEGHEIGVHTYSHKYKEIYKSVDAYLKDYNKIYTLIQKETGITPTIFRYPGGSNNVYNTLLQSKMTAEMFRRGFVPFDWNVDSGDASGTNVPAKTITKNALRGIGSDRAIVLMHDAKAKGTTAKALPQIIKGYKAAGYSFGTLSNSDAPILFSTPDGARYD